MTEVTRAEDLVRSPKRVLAKASLRALVKARELISDRDSWTQCGDYACLVNGTVEPGTWKIEDETKEARKRRCALGALFGAQELYRPGMSTAALPNKHRYVKIGGRTYDRSELDENALGHALLDLHPKAALAANCNQRKEPLEMLLFSTSWNDQQATHAEVLAVYDRAIEIVREARGQKRS